MSCSQSILKHASQRRATGMFSCKRQPNRRLVTVRRISRLPRRNRFFLTPFPELSYQFKYAEANNRSRAFPWSIRRTEIFNRIETSGETIKSTWLIFNPKEDSELSKRLADKAQDPGKWAALKANPLRLHIAILSTYIDNWRDFLEDIGKQYSELVGRKLRLHHEQKLTRCRKSRCGRLMSSTRWNSPRP